MFYSHNPSNDVQFLVQVVYISRSLFSGFFFFSLRFICLFERESEQEGAAEGEGERESQADSPLNGEPDTGLGPTTPRSYDPKIMT